MIGNNLFEKLNQFLLATPPLLAEIYFMVKKDDSYELKFANLDADSQKELSEQFIKRIKEEVSEDSEKTVISLSSADDRANALYHYDLNERPEKIKKIDDLLQIESHANFNFSENKLDDVKGILVLFQRDQETLVLYKHQHPTSLHRQRTFGLIKKKGDLEQLEKVTDDIIRINDKFEFLNFNGELYINNLKTLERFFGFHEIINAKAVQCIDEIEIMNILEDSSVLTDLLSDISFSRKLTKAGLTSPVIGKVPNERIVAFIENHPKLKGQFDFTEAKDKIRLKTKKSKVAFLKLLNDDYLKSELTEALYDSLAKDQLIGAS